MRNQTLDVDKETETLLSVAVLLKAGFDVRFVTGTKRDPTFGGYLVTPDGQKIRMIFGNNLWRLPMWSDPVRYKNDQTSPTKRNTLALVPTAAALEALAQPSLPDQKAMQLVHDMWCHPGNDKMEQIYKARRDSGTAIKRWTCHGCQCIFGSAQGLASHLKDSYRCPSSSHFQQPTAEPARRVLQRAEASNALHQIRLLYAACILTMRILYPLASTKRNIFYS
jgi:hypothetical protein